MSKDLGYKQTQDVHRRTWDRDYYEARAKERIEKGDDFVEAEPEAPGPRSKKEEFKSAEYGAAGPAGSQRAFLQNRKNKVDLESRLGKTQVVSSAAAPSAQGGWWCETCKCLLKDSLNYLDHINGKKHQRALGFSMRVERSTVKNRFKKHKQDEEDKKKGNAGKPSALEDYEARTRERAEEEARRKRQKKEAKSAARQKEEEEAAQFEDPDIAAMMGFGGFGPKK